MTQILNISLSLIVFYVENLSKLFLDSVISGLIINNFLYMPKIPKVLYLHDIIKFYIPLNLHISHHIIYRTSASEVFRLNSDWAILNIFSCPVEHWKEKLII